jgi:hypothetical protein
LCAVPERVDGAGYSGKKPGIMKESCTIVFPGGNLDPLGPEFSEIGR